MQRSHVAFAALSLLLPLAACGSDPAPAPIVVNTPPSVVQMQPQAAIPTPPQVDAGSLIQQCREILRNAYPNQNLAFGAPRAEPGGDVTSVSIPYVVGTAGSSTVNQTYGCRFQNGLMVSSGVRASNM